MTSSLMIRARDSGLIAPSLLHNDVIDQADNFETIAISALDVSGSSGKGFSLRSEISAAEEFFSLLKVNSRCVTFFFLTPQYQNFVHGDASRLDLSSPVVLFNVILQSSDIFVSLILY
mmetsp:Transcript_30892/g.45715  ORF Transcript_30892/g.45715 Transcript_30892/m.45715 type:complete len:118 (+) Transcript_30892:62-415(+)